MLAPWKKTYDHPRQHIKKQRHYFANKGPYSQSYGLPVAMCGCGSWIIKKAEHWRIGAFEVWCWGASGESLGLQGDKTNQSQRKSILNIHWKYWCWNWSSNTLAIWCKELTHWKRPWWGQEKKGSDRGWDGWMVSPLNGHEFEQTQGDSKGQGNLACCSSCGRKESDTTEWLNNNKTLVYI